MNHQTAVKELNAAILAREQQLSALTGKQGSPAEMEAVFFEAEQIRDDIEQLRKAIHILSGDPES